MTNIYQFLFYCYRPAEWRWLFFFPDIRKV